MNFKLITSLTLSSIILASGCSMQHGDYNLFPMQQQPLTMEQAKVDAKVAGTLMVLNKNELMAADVALMRSSNTEVRHYAELMRKEHSANLQQVEQWSAKTGVAPVHGRTAMMLKNKGKRELSMLKRTSAASFDRAYITAMINDHRSALNVVDKLIMQTSCPMLKRHLQTTRSHVAMHLKQAEMIRAKL